MSIKNMSKEELESLSYKEITLLLLEEKGPMNTADIFRKIVNALELSEKVFETKIGDFYTSLSTDKRFVLLEDGTWDLRSRHTSDKIIKATDEEEEEMEEIKEEDEEIEEEIEEDSYDSGDEEDDFDDSEDELKDLVVLDEDELELEQ